MLGGEDMAVGGRKATSQTLYRPAQGRFPSLICPPPQVPPPTIRLAKHIATVGSHEDTEYLVNKD